MFDTINEENYLYVLQLHFKKTIFSEIQYLLKLNKNSDTREVQSKELTDALQSAEFIFGILPYGLMNGSCIREISDEIKKSGKIYSVAYYILKGYVGFNALPKNCQLSPNMVLTALPNVESNGAVLFSKENIDRMFSYSKSSVEKRLQDDPILLYTMILILALNCYGCARSEMLDLLNV